MGIFRQLNCNLRFLWLAEPFHFCFLVDKGELFDAGPSSVAAQRASSFMPTACTTTMRGRTCQGSCRHPSSSAIWQASATASFSCLAPWASVPPCSLFATYTTLSSASRRAYKLIRQCYRERGWHNFRVAQEKAMGCRGVYFPWIAEEAMAVLESTLRPILKNVQETSTFFPLFISLSKIAAFMINRRFGWMQSPFHRSQRCCWGRQCLHGCSLSCRPPILLNSFELHEILTLRAVGAATESQGTSVPPNRRRWSCCCPCSLCLPTLQPLITSFY